MKKWKVKLPGGQLFTLESDTPHEELTARGYTEFALEDITNGLPDVKYPIPQWALDAAIEGLLDLAGRLEADAVELSRLNTTESRILAQEHLEKAWEAKQAHEYFLHL